MTRQEIYAQTVKNTTRQVWDGINQLKALQREFTALDYGSTFVNAAGEPTAQDLGAVVFDTANAIETLLNTGHATNMAKLL